MFESDIWHLSRLRPNSQIKLSGKALALGLTVVGGLMSLSGLVALIWFANTPPSKTMLGLAQPGQYLMDATTSATIWVDLGGAVKDPGVYQVGYGARLAEVVALAGGFSSTADKLYLNRDLNLAQRVEDEMKIYIPSRGEITATARNLRDQTQSASGYLGRQVEAGAPSLVAVPAEKISINQASKDDLMSLEGIGEVRAEKIIENRPYLTLDELVEKGVISAKVYEQNQTRLSL